MNAADILKYGHQFVTRNILGIPADQWEVNTVCGTWSCKQILAHLASYEELLIDVLNPFAGIEAPTPTLNALFLDHAGFNESQVARRARLSIEEILAEYDGGYAKNMELIAYISPESLREVGTIPWYGAEYSLDDFIVYSFYGHKREHMAQINVFKDSLAHL